MFINENALTTILRLCLHSLVIRVLEMCFCVTSLKEKDRKCVAPYCRAKVCQISGFRNGLDNVLIILVGLNTSILPEIVLF